MHKISTMLAAAVACAGLGAAAMAQEVTKQGGAVAGPVLSATTFVLANKTTEVLTTPQEGFFVLTTFCTSGPDMILQGDERFEFIARAGHQIDRLCQNFQPGIALPQSMVITCFNLSSGSNGCNVSGVLSQR